MTNRGLIDGCLPIPSIIRWLGLYQNPVVLHKGFDPTLLIEATFSGYARVNLDSTLWTSPPVIDSNGNATITYPELTFTKAGATANAAIWGFFYMDDTGTLFLFAQEFAAAPYPMVADGDLLRLTPSYSASNPIFP
jgi:hypothetical protein